MHLSTKLALEVFAVTPCRTHFTAAVASSGLHSHDADAWLVWPAPEPAEILWASLRLRGWQRRVRGFSHGQAHHYAT